jgi:hypothetical protein
MVRTTDDLLSCSGSCSIIQSFASGLFPSETAARTAVRLETLLFISNYTHIILHPVGYLEVIGGVQPTPVAAVLAYTMQHTKQINPWETKRI